MIFFTEMKWNCLIYRSTDSGKPLMGLLEEPNTKSCQTFWSLTGHNRVLVWWESVWPLLGVKNYSHIVKCIFVSCKSTRTMRIMTCKIMCAYSKHFLLCKYFTAILVASSVQVTLQFYFQIFYSTVPNKIVIKLTHLKRQTVKWKYLEDIRQLVIKSTFRRRNHWSMLQ